MSFTHRPASRHATRHLGVAAAALMALGLAGAAVAQTQPVQPQPTAPRPAQPAQPVQPTPPAQPARPAQPAQQPAAQRPATPQQGFQPGGAPAQPGQQFQQAQPPQQAPGGQPQAQEVQLVASGWTKTCGRDQQANRDVCFIAQTLNAETGQFIASLALIDVQNEPRKLLRALLPHGIQVQPGIRVSLDQQAPVNGKFIVCLSNGCMAEVEANADFVNRMKKGQGLVIQAQNIAGRTLNVTMPLNGFGKSYDGAAVDPKVVEEQQKKLQDEMQKRADELRKRLQEQGGQPAR